MTKSKVATAMGIRTMQDCAIAVDTAATLEGSAIEYLRSKNVLPRANAKGETAEEYTSYLTGFEPDKRLAEEFRDCLGVIMATRRDREHGERRYARTKDGKVRRATGKDKDEACFVLSAVAAFTRDQESITALPGSRGDLTTEKGLWFAERKTVQDGVAQRFGRLRSAAGVFIDATGKASRGTRASNKSVGEILAEAHGRVIKRCRSEGCAPWEEVQKVLKDAEQRVAALVDARKLDA